MRARPYSVARAHHGSSGQVFGTILEESRGEEGGRCDGGMRRREIRNPPSWATVGMWSQGNLAIHTSVQVTPLGHAERGECAAWHGRARRSTCRISEPFEMGGAQFGIALHMIR